MPPWERTDVVLQPGQRADHMGRKQIGPRRHDLTDLDEGRTERDEQRREPLAEPVLTCLLAAKCDEETEPSGKPCDRMQKQDRRDPKATADEPHWLHHAPVSSGFGDSGGGSGLDSTCSSIR